MRDNLFCGVLFFKCVCFGFKRVFEVERFFIWFGLELMGVELNSRVGVIVCGRGSRVFSCKNN